MRSSDAAVTARWLKVVAIPAIWRRHDTVLTPGLNAEIARQLRELAAILEKAARRKRRTATFASLIPKDALRAFGHAVAVCAPRFPFQLAGGVLRVKGAMRDASAGPGRGRPRLSSADLAAHIAGKRKHPRALNPKRWPARLKRREKVSAAFAAWSDEVRARGETVLTTTVPSPKI